MSTIDPSGQLLAQIRAQALAWRRRTLQDGSRRLDERTPSSPEAAQNWLTEVARAVVAIRDDDPDRRRKAFHVYLRAALARECGIRRVHDPNFLDLVDRVQETMEADPRLRKAILSAGEMLLRLASG